MNYKSLILFPVAALMLAGCNNPVFDDEGDCQTHYFMQFVYDMNLKWADAFPSEVNSVNLYAFDQEGKFVKDFICHGDELSQPGFMIELDLDPGQYQFVAWCGLYNDGKDMESFTVPEPVAGQTSIEELTCKLNTQTVGQYADCSDRHLYFLYHGYLEEKLPDSQDGASYYYTMPLVKDTNHIRVILQQLSAEPMDPSHIDFKITDSDGLLAYDNTLLGNTEITYLQWDRQSVSASVSKNEEDEEDIIYADGVMADLDVSRIMADHKNKFFLTITNTETEEDIIFRVPVIQYALLTKEYYEFAYNHTMTDQEFLDREDEYVLTFFLDQNLKWVDQAIYINSWRVVLHDYDLF